MQQSIFDELYPKYKITKPIRLIELFSGYGSQALALKYLGVPFEHWKICEWAVKSIQAYKDVHFTNINIDTSYGYSKDAIVDWLYKKGISSNYNDPMTKEQISRLSEESIRTIFNNIICTNNLVNIQQVKGKDLEIVDKEKYEYICSYSFPCQDLSNAGLKKGFDDTSTRSGMLWEVERILTELKEDNALPQVLLMENVPQLHDTGNVINFNRWKTRLEELGYKNYFEDLIATDYGIPQTRTRCFMISILGDYNYTFPKKIKLKLGLKDLLEDNVDEKYYLSEKMKKYLYSDDEKYKVSPSRLIINREIACTKTTREGCSRADSSDYICKELPNNFSLSLAKAKLNEMLLNNEIKENDVVGINYITRRIKENDVIVNNNITPTLTTRCASDYAITTKYKLKREYGDNQLRIRRLTPRECGRLMGLKDEDITNILSNQSNSSGYHLFGDSIVTTCLMGLFGQLLGIDWTTKFNSEDWWKNE